MEAPRKVESMERCTQCGALGVPEGGAHDQHCVVCGCAQPPPAHQRPSGRYLQLSSAPAPLRSSTRGTPTPQNSAHAAAAPKFRFSAPQAAEHVVPQAAEHTVPQAVEYAAPPMARTEASPSAAPLAGDEVPRSARGEAEVQPKTRRRMLSPLRPGQAGPLLFVFGLSVLAGGLLSVLRSPPPAPAFSVEILSRDGLVEGPGGGHAVALLVQLSAPAQVHAAGLRWRAPAGPSQVHVPLTAQQLERQAPLAVRVESGAAQRTFEVQLPTPRR